MLVHSALTEPLLSNLLRRQGKHREYLKHYLHNDVRHYRSEIDLRVNVQTLDKTPQVLKEVRESIIAR